MSNEQFMPQWQYEKLSQQEANALGTTVDRLVSIKIRPIEAVGIWHDGYVYDDEYAEIGAELAPLSQSAELHQLEDGTKFLFIKHENGPELIFVADVIQHYAVAGAATLLAARQLIKLINDICGILNRSAHSQNQGKPSKRYHKAGGISLERRTTKAAKILKQVEVTAKETRKVIDKITDLL